MFGAGLIGEQGAQPYWIDQIIERECAYYGVQIEAIYFKRAKQKFYFNGNYYRKSKALEFYFSDEFCKKAIWVILHEFCHALQHQIFNHTLTPKGHRRNRVVHNEAFFLIAQKVYSRYEGILDMAESSEYKTGRKYMLENLPPDLLQKQQKIFANIEEKIPN